MSALQLKRLLKVSYKTAWYLCHRIRAAMTDQHPQQLRGTVEVDETWVGDMGRGKGHHWHRHKMMVLGALERDGRIVMRTGTTPTSEVLTGFVRETIADAAECIMTDEAHGYHGIGDSNTTHETVQHSAREYVRGDVHTSGVEGAFGLFKRAIVGSFH